MDIQRPKVNVKTNHKVAPVTSDVVPSRPTPKVEMETFQPESEPMSAPMATKEPKQKKRGAWKMWLLGVVIVLLASGGVYAWQQQSLGSQISDLKDQVDSAKRGRDAAQATADQAAADLKKAQDDAAASATAKSAEADYFSVTELGFKFKPGADLKDLVYFVNGNNAYFSTKSLMAAAYKAHSDHPDMACAPSSQPLGVVTKSNSNSSGAVKVGSFYVSKSGPQSACSDDKTTNDLQTKQQKALTEALKTAVAN